MRDNLADAADDLREAPVAMQSELLNRIEHLTAMIRYGMQMLSDAEGLSESAGGGPRR
jgi:hypothetical protein